MTTSFPKRAVALRYSAENDQAPMVTAKGEYLSAERVIEAAKEAGVRVVEDPQLVDSLIQLELGSAIPPELYQVVAEVLAFVYRVDQRYAHK